MDKEKRGIYNVTFNNKNATPVKTDLEIVEDAVIEQITMYVKAFQDKRRDKGMGAKHIKLHSDENSEGQITLKELLDIGKSLREYTKLFKKPHIDERNAKIYEWQNNENIRFRVAIDKQRGGLQLPLSPFDSEIISFYSDRNLKERMKFKNPAVENYYKNKELDSHKSKSQSIKPKPKNKAKPNNYEMEV